MNILRCSEPTLRNLSSAFALVCDLGQLEADVQCNASAAEVAIGNVPPIRFALGATSRDVWRLVLGQGLRLTLIGVSLGLALSFILTRFLKSLLLGVTSTDALTFSAVTLLLCAAALFACFIPSALGDPSGADHRITLQMILPGYFGRM